jgi:hypothetical protein
MKINAVGLATAALLAALVTAPHAETMPPGVTEQQVKSAKTPEQHQVIADAYAKQAENLRAMADAHRHMDSWYAEPGYKSRKLGFPSHCRALVQDLEAAAKQFDALAKDHHEMAEAAAKKK